MQDMRSVQANKCLAKWRHVLSSSWLPRKLRFWTTVKAQRDKIASWGARTVANVVGVKKPTIDGNGPVVAQDGSPMDREMQHECADCHQRMRALLGWSRCQNGLLGNLREGLEMSGTSVVEMATTPWERSGERQMGWCGLTAFQHLQVGGPGVDRGLQVL